MAQAKKKQSTKTTKKSTQRKTGSRTNCRTCKKKQGISDQERAHLYLVMSMAIIAGILLCADAAMMMV